MKNKSHIIPPQNIINELIGGLVANLQNDSKGHAASLIKMHWGHKNAEFRDNLLRCYRVKNTNALMDISRYLPPSERAKAFSGLPLEIREKLMPLPYVPRIKRRPTKGIPSDFPFAREMLLCRAYGFISYARAFYRFFIRLGPWKDVKKKLWEHAKQSSSYSQIREAKYSRFVNNIRLAIDNHRDYRLNQMINNESKSIIKDFALHLKNMYFSRKGINDSLIAERRLVVRYLSRHRRILLGAKCSYTPKTVFEYYDKDNKAMQSKSMFKNM